MLNTKLIAFLAVTLVMLALAAGAAPVPQAVSQMTGTPDITTVQVPSTVVDPTAVSVTTTTTTALAAPTASPNPPTMIAKLPASPPSNAAAAMPTPAVSMAAMADPASASQGSNGNDGPAQARTTLVYIGLSVGAVGFFVSGLVVARLAMHWKQVDSGCGGDDADEKPRDRLADC
ncbi:hypothetical protein BC828DRAFT_399059 [Blastocladiella britannica]|nr:hypothetical protein BC828DRAFT_399059 [Blastocladiella britannica]